MSRRRRLLVGVLSACVAWLGMMPAAEGQARRPAQAKGQGLYTTSRDAAALRDQQVVLETTAGTIVMDLFGDAAPNHVGFMLDQVEAGAYDGTTFHRVVAMGIVQGGDPLSVDPEKRAAYGTGGLHRLARELNDHLPRRGAVAAVLVPGRPDSAGMQFFICVTDQPGLDGQFTVYGEVVEGLEVVEAISVLPADSDGRLEERVSITRAHTRPRPPPEAEPFASETVEELAAYRATLHTTLGDITLAFAPEVAPRHVRNFLRLAHLAVYDGSAFHRVVPGFAIQAGDVSSRETPLTQKQRRHVGTVPGEFSDLPHDTGTVSMARGDDPDSGSTSFFICTAPASALDGTYTVFGRVVEGLDVVEAIEQTPVDGESPRTRVAITRVSIGTQTP